MFVNHVAFSFSQFITYRSLGSVSVCMHLLTRALPSCMINLYQQWNWQLYEYRVLFSDAWLFLVAIKDNRSWWTIMADGEIGIRFRYFAMILFQTIMVFGDWVNLLQFKDTARWFRHIIYYCITCMIYRTRVCMLAVQSLCAWVCIWQTKLRACSHLHKLHTSDKVS